ncbi:hypothetical protein, partial [Brevibacillus agri]|uniref:hypothetical protein n=2 Tax=Brevibacillus TaxID=55080 RepID=UPI002E20FFDE|nr:hypothetical protein [Brevibacillus agri]
LLLGVKSFFMLFKCLIRKGSEICKRLKYKSATQVKRIVEKYTPQLQLYAYAVEKLLHWRVDRAGLYMTATGSYMEVPCDLQARENLWKKMQILWTKADSRSEEKEKRLFS